MTETEILTDVGFKAKITICQNALRTAEVRKEKFIGTGVSGIVVLMHHRKKMEEKKAMKFFTRKAMSANFYREVALLQNISHPHIMADIQAYLTPTYKAFMMPYYPRGTLRHHLRNLTEDLAKRYFTQLASAVHYLNQRQIVHRDIKPDNVLLTTDDKAVLTDFGFAHVLNTQLEELACSEGYRPPEMYSKTKKTFDYYKSDSYALGVTCWNMAWKTHDVCKGQCLHCLSAPLKDSSILSFIIYKLCDHDPQERWSMACMMEQKSEFAMLEELLGDSRCH